MPEPQRFPFTNLDEETALRTILEGTATVTAHLYFDGHSMGREGFGSHPWASVRRLLTTGSHAYSRTFQRKSH